MSISKRVLAATGIGIGLLGAADVAAARRWRTNPDPLVGEVPRFPPGDAIVVPTDDGAELEVLRAGEGPTIVLVHGVTSNADDWGPVARRLVERGFRIIGVNQRGHGRSTVGTDGFGAPRLALDVKQVLTALDLEDVVLVGHSMGGIATMSFAVRYPADLADRVSGLCLVATVADTTTADSRIGIAIIAGRPSTSFGGDHPVLDNARRRAARFVFGRKPNWRLMGLAVETALRCPDNTRIEAARSLLTYDITDRLSSIDVPTTVICGTADIVTRYPKNTDIAEAIPGARMVTAPGAGHLLLWETPDMLADEIAALARVG
jgi:pimeloyl-ACP methyl ester carboxylesterase